MRYLRCAQAMCLTLFMLAPQAGTASSLPAPAAPLADQGPCRDHTYFDDPQPRRHLSGLARGLPTLSLEIGRLIETLDRSQESYLLPAQAPLPRAALQEFQGRQPPVRWQLNLEWRFGDPPLDVETLSHGERRERIRKVGGLCLRLKSLSSPLKARVLTEMIARRVESERLKALLLIELATLGYQKGGISWLR